MPIGVAAFLAIGIIAGSTVITVPPTTAPPNAQCYSNAWGEMICNNTQQPANPRPNSPVARTPNPSQSSSDIQCQLTMPWFVEIHPEAYQRPSARHPGRVEQRMQRECSDGASETVWVLLGDDTTPAPDPQQLIPGLSASARRQIPTATVTIDPADTTDPDHYTFVQIPTFFWTDQTEPISARASLPGVWAQATATPARVIVDPGDGTPSFTCEGVPPRFPAGGDAERFDGCEHVYRDSSAMSDNGETFTVTVTVEWEINWSSSTGAGGNLGTYRSTVTRNLAVAEIQAIVTRVGSG